MIKNKDLKRRVIEVSYKLKLGHIGSCLTAVDIIDEIYKIKKPDEKFVLSAGHAHLAHLVVMEKYHSIMGNWENPDYLEELLKFSGIHCDRKAGCDVSTGSLGHGIGIAVGMALANRSKNVYCLLSDGEMAEGSVTESFRIMEELKLTNLYVYVNWNGWAAYREVNRLPFTPNYNRLVSITHMNDYPKWLQGQIAHYKVLDKEEYEELMELLK